MKVSHSPSRSIIPAFPKGSSSDSRRNSTRSSDETSADLRALLRGHLDEKFPAIPNAPLAPPPRPVALDLATHRRRLVQVALPGGCDAGDYPVCPSPGASGMEVVVGNPNDRFAI